ncbi:MAG: MBL fold metallo-hydrolase [Anaerolineaceae bacterium]
MIRVHTIQTRLSNAFLLENETGLFLVDACAPGSHVRVLQEVERLRKQLKLIFITHAHFDHYGSAAAVKAATQAPIAIHSADAAAMARGLTPIRSARGRGRLSLPLVPLMNRLITRWKTEADVLVQDGSRLDEYGLPARVLHTAGHTPGSTCLLVQNGRTGPLAFTGDLVTAGRVPALQRLYADDWRAIAGGTAGPGVLRTWLSAHTR